jgi:hypothetical protein
MFVMYDGLDVFTDLYLQRLPGAVGLSFGNHHDIAGLLERQKETSATSAKLGANPQRATKKKTQRYGRRVKSRFS